MAVIPLIPLFHNFNKSFFANSIAIDFDPIVKLRWSDDRLKTIAGFYKQNKVNGYGYISSEILL